MLVPSHQRPSGHREHALRVNESLPCVKEPAGHLAHMPAPFALHFESLAHIAHALLPATADVPARHGAQTPTPGALLKLPARHGEQAVFAFVVVNWPAAHATHAVCPVAP